MSTTDYIINAVLVLLVVLQIRERRLDLRSFLLPAVLVYIAARHYLHGLPTGGNDLSLIAVLASVGLVFGFLSARVTHVRVGEDGVALARAGWLAAGLWIAGIGSRMTFAVAASYGLRPAIASFSAAHHITGGRAWTAALVLMALCEVASRLATLFVRAQLATRRLAIVGA